MLQLVYESGALPTLSSGLRPASRPVIVAVCKKGPSSEGGRASIIQEQLLGGVRVGGIFVQVRRAEATDEVGDFIRGSASQFAV